MSHINKQSLREEVDRIKDDFDRLAANKSKKIDSEFIILIKSMFMLINLLVAVFLEKTTKKDNKNSSIPSSQTEKDDSSLTQPGVHGKGKLETHQMATNKRTVETITLARVTQ